MTFLQLLPGLGLVPGALIERELVFARRAKGELGGAAAQALVAVPLAFSGFGVWSLVARASSQDKRSNRPLSGR